MADIKKSMDVARDKLPAPASFTNPFDYKGIQPSLSAVPETPGEKAMNDASQFDTSGMPKVQKGSGYTG